MYFTILVSTSLPWKTPVGQSGPWDRIVGTVLRSGRDRLRTTTVRRRPLNRLRLLVFLDEGTGKEMSQEDRRR